MSDSDTVTDGNANRDDSINVNAENDDSVAATVPLLEGTDAENTTSSERVGEQSRSKPSRVEVVSSSNAVQESDANRPMTDAELQEEMEEHADVVLTVMKPVSITMVIVVAIVRLITLPSTVSQGSYLVYSEASTDSSAEKLGGALLNAAIVLVAILIATIGFVILYKCRCMKLIFGWLIMSSTMLLGGLGAVLFYLILSSTNSGIDWISFSFVAWNFGIVGVVSIFWHAPLKFQQGYLICVSCLLAVFMTRLPEWTTFAILAVVAVYDLFSVLCPKGPLRILVEEAQNRNESIPALLYSASVFMMMAEPAGETELQNLADSEDDNNSGNGSGDSGEGETTAAGKQPDEEAARAARRERRRRRHLRHQHRHRREAEGDSQQPSSGRGSEVRNTARRTEAHEEDAESSGKGIKLGLGDFVFYSVLVGRAAMYDMSTVFTCFIAVITGLFLTLLLLAVFRKALPALPISIALGLIFYFATRAVLLPFVIELATVQLFV